ncbi:MAG: MBL fold metallo-hydrolase [SAR202 cluster bacterium]|nr:MBL fold metallo-hydrolase [SAR202 cluster bacterium]
MMTTSIRLISDGTMKRDGGCMFGQVPKAVWENRIVTDRRNRMTLNLNCLLIQLAGKNILVDTGIGSKEVEGLRDEYGLGPSRLVKSLKALGVSPNQIDIVILTHLHFEHTGGCTKLDRTGDLIPTFPRATHFMQRKCWEEAQQPNERFQSVYFEDDFLPIEESGKLQLLDGDEEILPGLSVIVTNGPSKGHQIVVTNHGGEKVAFLGDLVPTAHHLDLAAIPALDHSPEDSLQQKREILHQAERDGWLLVFSHGMDRKAGYLERYDQLTRLRPIDL